MIYCVNKYQDVYKAMEDLPPAATVWDRTLCFKTEGEAKAFIIDRAKRGLEAAERALTNAKNRHRKVLKKFAAPLTRDAAQQGGKDG